MGGHEVAGRGLSRVDPDQLAVLPPGFVRELTEPWPTTKLPSAGENGNDTTVGDEYGVKGATFLSYDERFATILGDDPQLTVLAKRDYEFAHEGPVYLPESNEVFFTSNQLSEKDGQSRVELYAVDIANGTVRQVQTAAPVPFANGAAAYQGGVALLAQGFKEEWPGGILLLDPYSGDWRWLLNNWHGLHFNSPNDIVTTKDGALLFTDPSYGASQGIRGAPQLGEFVWHFKPGGPPARVVADGFKRPNGLSISQDQATMYVSDTGFVDGSSDKPDPSAPHTIYAYDLFERSGGAFLTNRRVFAVCDTGIPDGLKCDANGNVYSGCDDGLNVWAPSGDLIGKIVVDGGGVANFVFAGEDGDTLILLAEQRVLKLQLLCKGGGGCKTANNSAEATTGTGASPGQRSADGQRRPSPPSACHSVPQRRSLPGGRLAAARLRQSPMQLQRPRLRVPVPGGRVGRFYSCSRAAVC